MKTTINSYRCSLPLNKGQFIKLMRLGDNLGRFGGKSGYEVLVERLEPLGVIDRSVEFDPHFGRYLFFEVESGFDIQVVEDEIFKILKTKISELI